MLSLSAVFAPLAIFTHAKVKQTRIPEVTIKKVAEVTQSIKGPYLRGRVKFKDRYCYAFCQDSIVICRGEHVEVLEDKGTFLVVRPLILT
ncbi:NfeD family protein [Candidatus Albibeggiatoa sp. nov. BB20]|uniref:NfeD family protein n=1 Tax=Candidatus Albibeggiatoa sp. nov. BB20 TaxID=3162723 RepID=UPI003365604E